MLSWLCRFVTWSDDCYSRQNNLVLDYELMDHLHKWSRTVPQSLSSVSINSWETKQATCSVMSWVTPGFQNRRGNCTLWISNLFDFWDASVVFYQKQKKIFFSNENTRNEYSICRTCSNKTIIRINNMKFYFQFQMQWPLTFVTKSVLSLRLVVMWQTMLGIRFWAPSQYKDRLIYVWRFPC